ncbi:MAG: hypothetical protein PVJ60_03855, partial [Phycisphaerales bacterium]
MKKMILFCLIVVFAIKSLAFSATLYVPDEYPSIQWAISQSRSGDTIIVAPGRYYETINFMGKDIIVTSTDPDDPNIVAATIIDADSDGSTVTFENGETADAVLKGFTITGGYGTRNDAFGTGGIWGGGIYCVAASPTITSNVITDNHAPFDEGTNPNNARMGFGSAIGGLETNMIVTRNIIKDNTTYAGAGLFIVGDPVIRDNLIY